MYENNTYKIKINWKSLIIKLILIILFIILVLWLFPMPKLDTFYNRIFNENINTMKTTAKNYFVNSYPENIGNSKTIKLDEMINKNLLIEFKDKKNEPCNKTNSFAQITKTGNNEFVLKTQLSCGEETNYILETITTNSNVVDNNNTSELNQQQQSNQENTNINNPEDDEEDIINGDISYDKDGNAIGIIEYEFKKPIYTSNNNYSCPDGYTLEGKKCYKTETGETIKATELYFEDKLEITDVKITQEDSHTIKTDAIKEIEKSELICPDGYTLNKDTCYKYIEASVVPGTTTYSCPDGYILDDQKCLKTIDATKKEVQKEQLKCPEGYNPQNNKCIKVVDLITESTTKTEKYCPNGGNLNGNRCEKFSSIPAQYVSGTTSCNCPGGYNPDGNRCSKQSQYKGTESGYWGNPRTQSSSTPLSVYNNGKQRRTLTNAGSACTPRGCNYIYLIQDWISSTTCQNGGNPLSNGYCSYTEYRDKICTTTPGYYKCNNGSLNSSNNTCTINESYNASDKQTVITNQKCPEGYKQQNNKCIKETDATTEITTTITYSCPNELNYELKDDKCIEKIDANKNTSQTSYTCPEGFTKEGTTCYTTKTPEKKTTYKYYCPEGFTANGQNENLTCTKEVEGKVDKYCEDAQAVMDGDKCIKTIKGSFKGYVCPSDYILVNDECIKKTTSCINATTNTNTTVSYKYTWSKNKKLEGWIATGRTRTTTNEQFAK